MKKRSLLMAILHTLYWAPGIISFIYFFEDTNSDYWGMLSAIQAGYIVAFFAFYFAYFLLFPLIQKKKFNRFLLYGLVTIIISSAIGVLFAYLLRKPGQRFIINPQIINFPIRALSNIFIACVVQGFIAWYTDIRYKQQLEKQNLEAQLALLKAQINPHFLFNTLNNIDVLIEKDPQKASVYLQKLSGILRFMLYENTDEKIPLSKEVAYINEYIELQKIRTANPDFIQFTVQGNTGHTLVAPMLFIPFIENAFKHSTNKKIDKGISVAIKSDKDQIKFTCVNAYDEAAMQTQEHSGLGLELIQNRLDLLYPNQYRLDLDKTSDLFSVTLTININGN